MLNMIRTAYNQGQQFIKNIKTAEINNKFRGFPSLIGKNRTRECSQQCADICPTAAITTKPLTIDMGKCIFCGDCERVCPNKCISFTNFHKTASDSRKKLILGEGINQDTYLARSIQQREELKKIFGRSLKFRQVSAGGCNGCEMELNACSNVNFDMQRFGIDIAASPRHADGIIITGPVTENMVSALNDALRSVPNPKIIIAAGTCAISGGIFADSPAIIRDFFKKNQIDLYIPGCPVHPLTVINGILALIGR